MITGTFNIEHMVGGSENYLVSQKILYVLVFLRGGVYFLGVIPPGGISLCKGDYYQPEVTGGEYWGLEVFLLQYSLLVNTCIVMHYEYIKRIVG